MEVDIDEWILKAAVLKMDDRHQTHESYFLWHAFRTMYPETQIVERVRQQVQEYKKLTMWRE